MDNVGLNPGSQGSQVSWNGGPLHRLERLSVAELEPTVTFFYRDGFSILTGEGFNVGVKPRLSTNCVDATAIDDHAPDRFFQ